MAGVVAMASVIEDFDTQPCKKSRKDGSSPVVKTITNYFSPVPKPPEKLVSPPRSNNIMDYFISRKPPSTQRKPNPQEKLKEKSQISQPAEKHASSEKRSKKTSRAAKKLVPPENTGFSEDSSCFIAGDFKEKKDSVRDVVGSCDLNPETTPLAKVNSEDNVATETSGTIHTKTITDEQTEKAVPLKDSYKCKNTAKNEQSLNASELSPAVSMKNEGKQVKSSQQKTHRRQRKKKHSDEKETEISQSDAVSLEETSPLNKSTVKISFKDFLRSQNQNETEEDMKEDTGKEDASMSTAEPQKVNSDQVDVAKDEENVSSLSVQVSPRIVTITAEVHPVSSKHEPVGKLASIFNRKKAKSVSKEKPSTPQAEMGRQIHTLNAKRKSNVVIQEEDLEVVVLESESTPKCSEAERKQFMAAFKQPGLDGSKTKPVKMQSKQKQAEENIPDDVNKVEEDPDDKDSTPATIEAVCPEKKAATNKLRRKKQSKSKEKKKDVDAPPPSTPLEETATKVIDVEEESEDSAFTSTPSAVRRSKREAMVRKTQSPTTPVRKTRRSTASSQESLLRISAPKTPKSRHGVFVAEILSPPDLKESPIRIRFSRVSKNVSTSKKESGRDKNTSYTNKVSRKQAKKLVEKAKVMKQSKKPSVGENTLRRSSRVKTSLKKSFCEDEDSIIFVEDFPSNCQSKTQKPLRSLNDVLGKAASASKEAQTNPASSKLTPKVSAVISIFEESSKDGSENSQDDEQFRARREFLKSGLPESFKKQIAKNAATKEAYTRSCSAFQTVTHTTQQSDCPLWSLPWPESSSLTHLKDIWRQTSNPFPPLTDSFSVKTFPTCRKFGEKVSGWRPEIPENVRQLLMEEFSSFNPQFPAQMHIDRLLKKRSDHHQQLLASAEQDANTQSSTEPVGGKRKRKDEEAGNSLKAKKQRSTPLEENVGLTKRRGRPRRGRKTKLGKDQLEKTEPGTPSEEDVVIIEDSNGVEEERRKEVIKEDVLWTDKYHPQQSSDIIDNPASVKKLYNWLKEWKLRADREERKNQKDKKHEDDDADWDCGDDSLDGDDMLCNTMIITGPSGVGKTTAVYACAQELGFKVFEVNSSSQRSGRLILSQLREATQSHQVDTQGVNAYKPCYFNNYATSTRPGSSPRRGSSPRAVVSSPRKNPQSPKGGRKGGLAPMSLANFFKINQPIKEPPKTKTPEQTDASHKVRITKSCKTPKDLPANPPTDAIPKEKKSEEQNKKTATSLILFEEVDVIFEDDSGFLAAIKTFMTTTKRPVILTTSDPAFSTTFDGSFEEIQFKTPSTVNVCSYLQLLCLAEDVRTNQSDITSLLRQNGCDIRQSLLQLQFWTRGAGGRSIKSLTHFNQNETEGSSEKSNLSELPPCDTGCTESKLGMLNIEPEKDIWELFRSRTSLEEPVCWELLMPSRQRQVDLLYSNLETLLPLPRRELTTSKPPLSDTLDPSITSESVDCSDSGSPFKMSHRMKKHKKHCRLPVQDQLESEPDSEDEFKPLKKSRIKPHQKAEEPVASERLKRKTLTPQERIKSRPVSQCLQSIADFFDNISYIDSTLISNSLSGSNQKTGTVLKDGMMDESRTEADGGSWSVQSYLSEVQAAVEALSFSRCRTSVAEAWEKIQQLEGEVGKEAADEVTLPVSAHQEGESFTQNGPCHPELIQKRKDLIESLMLKSTFGFYGNKQAAALDYLPAVRNICRLEQLKEKERLKRRFLHYLDTINLGLERKTLKLLAAEFP